MGESLTGYKAFALAAIEDRERELADVIARAQQQIAQAKASLEQLARYRDEIVGADKLINTAAYRDDPQHGKVLVRDSDE